MKLIRLELTLIIVETNAPFRVRVPPTTTVATNRSPPPLLPSWSLFLDQEEEEWVEEERPALLEEFSPTREIDAATVSSSFRDSTILESRGSTIFHLVSRCRTDSPFPFARKGERERKRRDVAKNMVGIFRTPVISRERGYRFFHRSFPRLLFCSCICPSLKADFSISIFGGEEGREEGSSRVNFVQEDEDEVFFFPFSRVLRPGGGVAMLEEDEEIEGEGEEERRGRKNVGNRAA